MGACVYLSGLRQCPTALSLRYDLLCFLLCFFGAGTGVSQAQDIQHYRSALGTVNYLSVDGAKVAATAQYDCHLSSRELCQ